MSALPGSFMPLTVRAPRGGETLEIDWADGHTSVFPNELLRGYCPCAACQGHSATIRFVEGHSAVLDGIAEVGNYGLAFTWGDGHASGIYDFRYLRALCACDACFPGSVQSRKDPLTRV